MNERERFEGCVNTDKEIWRERPYDYYADSIHVTKEGSIGINCGGTVIVMPVRKWHALAQRTDSLEQAESTDPLIASLRSLASELDADDSPEQIHPGAAICRRAADMLGAFRLQRDLDGPAWERHVERMRLAEDEVQRLKAALAQRTEPQQQVEPSVLGGGVMHDRPPMPQQQVEPTAITDSRCSYMMMAGHVCNKCGRIHDGEPIAAPPAVQQAEPVAWQQKYGNRWMTFDGPRPANEPGEGIHDSGGEVRDLCVCTPVAAPPAVKEPVAQDAARYQRLRILGVAPGGSRYLDSGLVLRFTNLDQFVDDDLKAHPSRGEYAPPVDDETAIVVTWDETRTRIVAVTRQDCDGRIVKVIAEAPADDEAVRLLEDIRERLSKDYTPWRPYIARINAYLAKAKALNIHKPAEYSQTDGGEK